MGVGGRRPADVPGQPEPHVPRRRTRPARSRRCCGAIPTPGCAALSSEYGETRTWCGTGWVGQPAVFERDGRTWVVFGAYDYQFHFVDAATGQPILPPFPTGDIAKGTVTVDPDGFPLVYGGSRDNKLRVLAIDRPEAGRAVGARLDGRGVAAAAVEQRLGRRPADRRRLPRHRRREQPLPRRAAQPLATARTGSCRWHPSWCSRRRRGTTSCWPTSPTTACRWRTPSRWSATPRTSRRPAGWSRAGT